MEVSMSVVFVVSVTEMGVYASIYSLVIHMFTVHAFEMELIF